MKANRTGKEMKEYSTQKARSDGKGYWFKIDACLGCEGKCLPSSIRDTEYTHGKKQTQMGGKDSLKLRREGKIENDA